jgi:hypothetical protein
MSVEFTSEELRCIEKAVYEFGIRNPSIGFPTVERILEKIEEGLSL